MKKKKNTISSDDRRGWDGPTLLSTTCPYSATDLCHNRNEPVSSTLLPTRSCCVTAGEASVKLQNRQQSVLQKPQEEKQSGEQVHCVQQTDSGHVFTNFFVLFL